MDRRRPVSRLLAVTAVLLCSALAGSGAAAAEFTAPASGAGSGAGSVAGSAAGGGSVPRAAGTVPRAAAPPAGTQFVLPVPGSAVVLVPFRPPPDRYGAGHRGVDLAAPVGTAVRAAGAGRVVFAGVLAGRGVVSVEHVSGLRTTYEPLAVTVSTGATVASGDPIGTVLGGHPPCAPASCLHWGARRRDGSYVDPLALIGWYRVRLLPWGS